VTKRGQEAPSKREKRVKHKGQSSNIIKKKKKKRGNSAPTFGGNRGSDRFRGKKGRRKNSGSERERRDLPAGQRTSEKKKRDE